MGAIDGRDLKQLKFAASCRRSGKMAVLNVCDRSVIGVIVPQRGRILHRTQRVRVFCHVSFQRWPGVRR